MSTIFRSDEQRRPILNPATTEKIVNVYSNSKMVAQTRDADELKKFAWDSKVVTPVLLAAGKSEHTSCVVLVFFLPCLVLSHAVFRRLFSVNF